MIFAVFTLLFAAASAVPLPTNCGVPQIKPSLTREEIPDRVVGGKEAIPNSWPWQVQLRYNGGHYCGGSVLSNDWVLTAAHCVYGKSSSSYSIRAGRHTRSGNDRYEQASSVKKLDAHQSYSPVTLNNDVALIRLNYQFTFNKYVQPICLAGSEPAGGTKAWVTGWGNVKGTCCDGYLKQAMLPIYSRSTCSSAAYWGSKITQGMICAGHDNAAHGACNGDSGGPLVVQKGSNLFEQVGVVSWGSSNCQTAKKPTVFANVYYYSSWIRSRISQVEREEAELQGRKFNPRLGAAFRASDQY